MANSKSKRTNMVNNHAFSNSWKVTFSNFPLLVGSKDDIIDFGLLEYHIKSIQMPDFGVNVILSNHYNKIQETPSQISNEGNQPFSITFSVSEGFENYKLFHNWINGIRYKTIGFIDDVKKINNIKIDLLTNQKKPSNTVILTNVYVSNISGVTLTSGEGNELEFTVTFNHQEVSFTTV